MNKEELLKLKEQIIQLDKEEKLKATTYKEIIDRINFKYSKLMER